MKENREMKLSDDLRGYQSGYIHLPFDEFADKAAQLEDKLEDKNGGKVLSKAFYILGMVAILFALFWDLPVVSGSLEAGKWAFIATLFSIAAYHRAGE